MNAQNSEALDLPTLAPRTAERLVQLFKLFSDETRLRILHYLMHKDELNVRTLCGLLKQSQPAVSHHLALLRAEGLIDARRDGKHNFYRLISSRFQEFAAMLFNAPFNNDGQVAIDKEGRICFDTFILSFSPLAQAAPPGNNGQLPSPSA